MSSIVLATLLLIVAGAIVMLLAIVQTRALFGSLPGADTKWRWQLLAGLMVFFLLGYATTALVVLFGSAELLMSLTGLVFFFGSVFVLLVVGTGRATIGEMQHHEAESKVAEDRASSALDQLSTIVDNLADGLVAIRVDGTVELTNPALLKLFQLPFDPKGETVDALPGSLVSLARACLEAGEVVTRELPLPDGRIARGVASTIRSAEPSPTSGTVKDSGVVMILRDITLDKEIDRMKSDFTAVVSHELRTPLTSVLGFAKLIRNALEKRIFPALPEGDKRVDKAREKIRLNLDIVLSEGKRLTALINDVLDISKMESGQMQWNIERLQPHTFLDQAMQATTALFTAKPGVKMVRDLPDELPAIDGDPDRLVQVVINLISNAVKFTDVGSVTISAKAIPVSMGFEGAGVRISVTDTGIGLEPQDRQAVFEKFKQVGDTLTDRPKGTGLGLPICREIITHLGGIIYADSTPGEGSTFAFELPLTTGTQSLPPDDPSLPGDLQSSALPTADQTDEAVLEHLSRQLDALQLGLATRHESDAPPDAEILVVDDDPSIRNLLEQQLTERGYRVRLATNGMEAMTELRRAAPDLVLLDVMMPGLSGFDVAAMLRSDPELGRLPIVILSIVEDTERGYQLGVDRFLHKPIDAESLVAELEPLLANIRHGNRVLMVGSFDGRLRRTRNLIREHGLEIVGQCGREECLERARATRPQVVVLEGAGPSMDALARELRGEPGLEGIHLLWLLGAPTPERLDRLERLRKG